MWETEKSIIITNFFSFFCSSYDFVMISFVVCLLYDDVSTNYSSIKRVDLLMVIINDEESVSVSDPSVYKKLNRSTRSESSNNYDCIYIYTFTSLGFLHSNSQNK